ncbi:MAG: ABC-F family ATP-binding cassette domain-containing protein [Chlamydiales bacterium]
MSMHSHEQLGLIGCNGSGKSTLLKILAGLEEADSGEFTPRKGLKVGYLPQSCDFSDQSLLEILGGDRLAESWLSKMGFTDKNQSAATLSGGWKKRLALAKVMIGEPDVILLDEPTNHLDLEGVVWLENFLKRGAPAYLVVSHDRYFLQNTVGRVIEMDPVYPDGIFTTEGSYAHFLEKKEEFLQGQLKQERSLAGKARRELDWVRAGVKARTTKSRSRLEEAEELFAKHADVKRRNTKTRAKIDFVASERESRKLLVAKNIAKKLGERQLFEKLDFTLSPGTRMGLMGQNGSGKTTLLRLIADELEPDQGTMKRADNLKTIYFDQHRSQLPLDITLREALSPQGDYIIFRGHPIHVNGWCKRFLFSPDLLDMQIGRLSGGERARISIAHLMLQPADLLLLDEPTNDLDIPTLETLEESLLEFPGAVVLITHDRCMLDRICNTLLSIEQCLFYADFAQWQQSQVIEIKRESKPKSRQQKKAVLSYMEKKEYEEIEGKIGKLEEKMQQLHALLDLGENLQESCAEIALVENQIEQLYLRWDELDQKQ